MATALLICSLLLIASGGASSNPNARAALTAAFPLHNGRVLQQDDPCVDFGNCTTATIALFPGASAVGDYHVTLWTSVLLVLILLGSLCTLLGMESRDAQLFVQLGDAGAAAGGGRAR